MVGKQHGITVTKSRSAKKQLVRYERDGKYYTKRGIELTRCSGTMTEAQFFSFILSHCRRLTLKWKPRQDKFIENRRPYTGKDKRIKWEYDCQICGQWFVAKDIHMDHIITCGGIRDFASISGWFERSLCEKNGFRRLCKACHLQRTNEDRGR